MFDSEKLSFKSTLDTLADMLHVERLDDWQKDEYFKALRKFSSERYMAGIRLLQESYEPKRSRDFPVLSIIRKACNEARINEKSQTWKCRCCQVSYPANSTEIKCPCDLWEHCFRCDKCHNHCKCPLDQRISVDQISAQCVAEFSDILKNIAPSLKRSRPEVSALKREWK